MEHSAEEQVILDSAIRHAALRDPTLGSNAWTLSSSSMAALPSSARIAAQLAADKGARAARLRPEPAAGRSETDAKQWGAGSSAAAEQVPSQRQAGQATAPESTLRTLLKQV